MLTDVTIRPFPYPFTFDRNCRPEDVEDMYYFEHPRTGVYVGWESFGDFMVEPHNGSWDYPKTWEEMVQWRAEHGNASYAGLPTIEDAYGVCDSEEQFMERFCDELDQDPRPFCVTLCTLFKKDQPKEYGWRWHKWGTYLGDKNPQCEYLADEGPDITQVTLFHIYLILGPAGTFVPGHINNTDPDEWAGWQPKDCS